MAYGYYLEAEYESGFRLTESEINFNPYSTKGNTFTAMLDGSPTEAGHGQMVRFSLIPESGEGNRYDIDWKPLWKVDDPRPIYYRKMQRSLVLDTGEDSGPSCNAHFFGFQYLNEDGENVQEVEEIIGDF